MARFRVRSARNSVYDHSKTRVLGASRNPSVCANTPYQSVGALIGIPECWPVRGEVSRNGTRRRKVSKASAYSTGARKLWKPKGWLPPQIKFK